MHHQRGARKPEYANAVVKHHRLQPSRTALRPRFSVGFVCRLVSVVMAVMERLWWGGSDFPVRPPTAWPSVYEVGERVGTVPLVRVVYRKSRVAICAVCSSLALDYADHECSACALSRRALYIATGAIGYFVCKSMPSGSPAKLKGR